ncbi:MAG: reverse transcriptase-like protein [Candidatus Microsaccharimonas sp.]
MNQRVSVRAIVRNSDKTLIIRRANGRSSILGKFELPGGKLEYGEQPEDAITRYVSAETGLNTQTAQLYDVLTYIDHDDRDMQYVFILYLVSIEGSPSSIELSENYDHYLWKKVSEIHQDQLTESTKLLLGISQQIFQSVKKQKLVGSDVSGTTNLDHIIVYSDGGSRGNPGPSASGFVIMNAHEDVVHEGGMYLGITTNNQAEYHGVRLGLEKALELGARTVDFRIDSLLVVNQMNGLYTIKNRELWPINDRIRQLVKKFDKVSFTHVRREYNQLADGMVNKILDAHGG